MYILIVCINSLKDVVKLQNENSSLKSSFQQLEQNTIQQAKRLEVRTCTCIHDIHVHVHMCIVLTGTPYIVQSSIHCSLL